MSNTAGAAAMGADFNALFTYDFPQAITINGTEYQCIPPDAPTTEQDEEGGPIGIDMTQVHLRTSDVPSIEPGTVVEFRGKKFIVVEATASADGNVLIVTMRIA